MIKRKKWSELTEKEKDKQIRKEMVIENISAILLFLLIIAESFVFLFIIKPHFFSIIVTLEEWMEAVGTYFLMISSTVACYCISYRFYEEYWL